MPSVVSFKTSHYTYRKRFTTAAEESYGALTNVSATILNSFMTPFDSLQFFSNTEFLFLFFLVCLAYWPKCVGEVRLGNKTYFCDVSVKVTVLGKFFCYYMNYTIL